MCSISCAQTNKLLNTEALSILSDFSGRTVNNLKDQRLDV